MDITEVRIVKIVKRGALLAYANVVVDGCFVIKGIKILETERKGRFIAMPSKKLNGNEKRFMDICHPINQETRDELLNKINPLKFALKIYGKDF